MAQRIEFGTSTNLGNVASPVNAQDAATKQYVDARGITITSPNATLTVGGTSSAPTLDIAQQSATNNQALVWNGTKFAPADPSLRLLTTVALGLNTSGSVASGTSLVSVAGDQRAIITAGRQLLFSGSNQVYVVGNNVTFNSGLTDFTIIPAAVSTIPAGTALLAPTRTPFTDVLAGNNITASVSQGALTLNATGGGGTTNLYGYNSALNYSGLRLINGVGAGFSGNPDTTNTGTCTVVFNASAVDGQRPNITISNITNATFSANQSFFIFAPDASWNITYSYFDGTATQLAANTGILNTTRGNTVAAATYTNCLICGVDVVNTDDARQIRFSNTVAPSSLTTGLRIFGDTSNFTNLTLTAGSNLFWDNDPSANPRLNVSFTTGGNGWNVSISASFITSITGNYAAWLGNDALPVFLLNGQVVQRTGFNSATYGGQTLTWTANPTTNQQQFWNLYRNWHNSFSDALQITNISVIDTFRTSLQTAIPTSNPTQTNAQVQAAFSVGNSVVNGSAVIDIAYDDAGGTIQYQRAVASTSVIRPAGSDGQIQFNNLNTFGASANLTWDNTNSVLTAGTPAAGVSLSSAGIIATSTAATANLNIAAKGSSGVVQIASNLVTALGIQVGADTSSVRLQPIGIASNANLELTPKNNGNVSIGNVVSQSGFQITGGLSSYTELRAVGTSANIDLVLTPKGTGSFYPIGPTLSATAGLQPKIIVASSSGSTTLSAGAAGQALISNGSVGAPYWGSPRFNGYVATGGGIQVGSFTIDMLERLDTLSLTTSGNAISGFVANKLYLITINAQVVVTQATTFFTSYFALSTSSAITTNVSYGSGCVCSINRETNLIPSSDWLSSSAEGIYSSGATPGTLYLTGYVAGTGSVNVTASNYIAIVTIELLN